MDRGSPSETVTTLIVRRAVGGAVDDFERMWARFTPGLLAQARYYLGKELGAIYGPEDLVQEVWRRTFHRLGDLEERNGRITPVLQKFLSTTLKYHYNNLLAKHIRGKPRRVVAAGSENADPLDQLLASVSSPGSRLVRQDEVDALYRALDELSADDREVVILRGLEQMPNADVAILRRETEAAVKNRYMRARRKLKEQLPGSIFDELGEDPD